MRYALLVATIAVAFALTVSAAQNAANKGEQKSDAGTVCILKVSGMTCSGCEAPVRSAARKVGGVKGVKVSYRNGTAEVTYNPAKTTPEAIAKAITETSGFKAEAPKRDSR